MEDNVIKDFEGLTPMPKDPVETGNQQAGDDNGNAAASSNEGAASEGGNEGGGQQQPVSTEWWREAGKKTGREYQNEDEFVSEYTALKNKPSIEIPDILKPFHKDGKFEIPDHAKELLITAQKGDPKALKEYYKIRSLDPESLPGFENEKMAYIRENAEKLGSMEAAEASFKVEYGTKYSVLEKLARLEKSGADEETIAEFKEVNAYDLELQGNLRKINEEMAKQRNTKWLESQLQTYREQEARPSDQEIQAAVDAHLSLLGQTLGQYKGYEVSIENGDPFVMGISDAEKPLIEKAGREFFSHLSQEYGVDLQTGKVLDYNKFVGKLHKDISVGNTGKLLTKHILEQDKAASLRGQRENPITQRETSTVGSPDNAEARKQFIDALKASRGY